MENKQIEVYSEGSNVAVIRIPEKRFPGSVIQGDYLSILYSPAKSLHQRAIKTREDELISEAEELKELLEGHIRHYEATLEMHRIDLLYAQKLTT